MSIFHYAIEIILDGDFPDRESIGLKDNVFRFVTDRPSYDGSTIIPIWGEHERESGDIIYSWYENLLTRDGITQNPGREIDISMAGNYGTLSGLTFTLRNDVEFLEICRLYDINLCNRRVNFYVVIDDVFYQFWSGVIANNPIDEVTFQFVCQDDSQQVHKTIPPNVISPTAYPDSTNQGDAIPVCIGNVPHAELKNTKNLTTDPITNNLTNSINLNNVGTTLEPMFYKQTAAFHYFDGMTGGLFGHAVLNLITTNLNSGYGFGLNELAGYYLMENGEDKIYKIFGNHATIGNLTRVLFSEQLPYTMDVFNNNNGTGYIYILDIRGLPDHPQENTKWFQIFPPDIEYKFSQIETDADKYGAEIANDGLGYSAISLYNKDLSKYESIGDLIDISETDRLRFLTNNVNVDGVIKNYKLVKFGEYYAGDPALGSNLMWDSFASNNPSYLPDTTFLSRSPVRLNPQLIDYDRSTYYETHHSLKYHFIVMDYTDIDISDIESICAGIDFDTTVVTSCLMSIAVQRIDIFGKLYPIGEYTQVGINPIASDGHFNIIPNNYYDMRHGSYGADNHTLFNDPSTGGKFVSDNVTLPVEILDWIKQTGKVRVWFQCRFPVETNTKIKEFAIFGLKTYETIKGDLFAKVEGEKVGYYPDGSLNPNSTIPVDPYTLAPITPTNTVYHAFMHILEDYDKLTHIDYHNLPLYRIGESVDGSNWYVGRQLTEQKNSLEYLIELAKHSFVGIFTNRLGYKHLSAWLQDNIATIVHNQDNIVRDSIAGWEQTDVTNLFNEFTLNYAYNPASQKFEKSFSVKYTDDDRGFPLLTADPYDRIWTDYFSGFADLNYDDAKRLWEQCHTSWLKNKTTQNADTSLTECYWFIDGSVFEYGVQDTTLSYLQNLIIWTTRQKDTVNYAISITPECLEQLELLIPLSFADVIFTDSVARLAWIYKIELDVRNNNMLLSIIFYPPDEYEDTVIIERGIPLNDGKLIIERGIPLNDGSLIIEGS